MTIEEVKEKIIPILKQSDVEYAGVFGSVARGEARSDSDVDILVRFSKTPGLIKFIRLENQLKEVLGKEVDLIIEGSEKEFVKPAIQRDLIKMYG